MAKDTKNVPIPESSEELAEVLADDKRRQEVFATAEGAAEFQKNYVAAINKARPDVQKMITDGIDKGMQTFMEESGIQRPDITVNVNQNDPTPLRGKGASYNRRALGAILDKEFTDTADFLYSIWHKNQAGADRWRKIRNDYSSIDPSAGGFLVPEILRAELLRVALETAIVRSRARVIPMDSSRVPFPTIDSTSGTVRGWSPSG